MADLSLMKCVYLRGVEQTPCRKRQHPRILIGARICERHRLAQCDASAQGSRTASGVLGCSPGELPLLWHLPVGIGLGRGAASTHTEESSNEHPYRAVTYRTA